MKTTIFKIVVVFFVSFSCTIYSQIINLPNYGTIWTLGQKNAPIVWTTEGEGGNVEITLCRYLNVVLTISSSTPNDGQFTFDVPANLTVASNYYLRVRFLKDGHGAAQGEYFSITSPSTKIPIVMTLDASNIEDDGANVNGEINPQGSLTNVVFEYGETVSFGSEARAFNSPFNGTSSIPVKAYLSGLKPQTLYYFRAKGTCSSGTEYGKTKTFKTATSWPTVVTGEATEITDTSTALKGSINPNGRASNVYFEIGTTSNYTFCTPIQDAGSQTSTKSVTQFINNLSSGTIYHFRIVGVSSGGVSYGQDKAFTTNLSNGSLTVKVKDMYDDNTGILEVKGIIVQLFNSLDQQIGGDKPVDNFGNAEFSNIPSGNNYYIKVFDLPGQVPAIFGKGNCGTSDKFSIKAGETLSLIFRRNQPYIKDIKIFQGSTEVTGQTVTIGSNLIVKIFIANPNNLIQYAKGNLIIDRDKSASDGIYDLNLSGTSFEPVPANNLTMTQTIAIIPAIAGTYYSAAACIAEINGAPIYTDVNPWSIQPLFTAVLPEDFPPAIEVYKIFQTGDMKLHVIAKVTDDCNLLDDKTVKLKYLKIPASLLSVGESSVQMKRMAPNSDYFEGIAVNPSFKNTFDEGQAVVLKIEAQDKAGHLGRYPEDLSLTDKNVVTDQDPLYANQGWCQRLIISSSDKITETARFHYLEAPSGAITFTQEGNSIKVLNNTSIWYSLTIFPADSNYTKLPKLGILLKPREGIIPMSIDGLLGDRSILLEGINKYSKIVLVANRKTPAALFCNTFDMVLVCIKPGLEVLTNEEWDAIKEEIYSCVEIAEIENDIQNKDYSSATNKIVDAILSYRARQLFEDALLKELTLKGITGNKAKDLTKRALKMYSGAVEVIKGINNRAAFLIDIFHFPSDIETLVLLKESKLDVDLTTMPGKQENQVSDRIYSGDAKSFNIRIIVPEENQQLYTRVFAEAKIYAPDGTLIDWTSIPELSYNSTGKISLKIDGSTLSQGININAQKSRGRFNINLSNIFDLSSAGQKYISDYRPYFIELKLYQGGIPNSTEELPFIPDELLSTGKIPFYIYDRNAPLKPKITDLSSNCAFNYAGFGINNNQDSDISYFKVFRKFENESTFSLLDSVKVRNLEKESILFFDYFKEQHSSFSYKIQAVDISGNLSPESDIISLSAVKTTGELKNSNSHLPIFTLQQNYPNPFNPVTTIGFSIPVDQMVSISVYDLLGNVIAIPLNEFKAAGNYQLRFDGTNLSSGTYFYRLQAGEYIATKKFMIVK